MITHVIGINFKTAPLNAVARLQFDEADAIGEFLAAMRLEQGVSEVFFLQTCNRREFYFIGQQHSISLTQLLARLTDAIGETFDASHFFELSGTQAIRHLFQVTASLESMVLGETEITKQVKTQFGQARAAGYAGPYLKAWVNAALRAAKRVRSETEITKNVISMASLAKRYAERHVQKGSRGTIAFVGAGQYINSIMPHFAKLVQCDFVFVNRTQNSDLSDRYGGLSVGLETFLDNPPSFDVLVTATTSPQPIFSAKWLASHQHPIMVLDLALPRDVELSASHLQHVTLWGLEEMEAMLESNRIAREQEIPKAEPILEDALIRLNERWLELDLANVHQEIAAHYRRTGDRAVDFLLKELPADLSQEHGAHLRLWADDLVKRLIHVPVLGLRGVVDEYGTHAVSAYTKRISAATPLFRKSDQPVP